MPLELHVREMQLKGVEEIHEMCQFILSGKSEVRERDIEVKKEEGNHSGQ